MQDYDQRKTLISLSTDPKLRLSRAQRRAAESKRRRKRQVCTKLSIGLLLACALIAYPIYQSMNGTPSSQIKQPDMAVQTVRKHPASPQKTPAARPPVRNLPPAEPMQTLWGNARITAYCSCEQCCGKWSLNRPVDPDTGSEIVYGANSVPLVQGVSVAAPRSIPFGTKLTIPSISDAVYEVQDRMAEYIEDRYDGYTVDVYFANHQEALDWGHSIDEWYDVYIVEE